MLWLGPELWGSGNALRASDRAQQPNADSAAFADNPALEVVKNAFEMLPPPALVGLVLPGVVLLTAPGAARRTPASRSASPCSPSPGSASSRS